jgi:chemotaxis protein histidine kinase CheA
MSEDQVRSAIDAIRARLQSELDVLGQQQAEAVAAARRAAEAEAERQWTSKADALRTEWAARLESEVAAVKAEADRRVASESARLKTEAEGAAARVRAEAEGALATERQALQEERRKLEADRQRLQQEAATERDRLERESAAREKTRSEQAAAESTAALTDARAAERHVQLAAMERLLAAMRSIDSARSLSDVLAHLVKAAAAEGPRAALFIVNGGELQGWKGEGFTGAGAIPQRVPTTDAGLLGQVFRGGEALTASEGSGRRAPDFAALPADRAAIAVPIAVDGVTVAILYADDAAGGEHQAPASWPEAVQILGRHASACVSYLTAVRTAQASRLVEIGAKRARAADDPAGNNNNDDDSGARRYARLLVSEIKLYNEGAVRAGREKRDLLHRLREEIERARRLYEERVPPGVTARNTYFQQELVQTLAGGDPACLGGPA